MVASVHVPLAVKAVRNFEGRGEHHETRAVAAHRISTLRLSFAQLHGNGRNCVRLQEIHKSITP